METTMQFQHNASIYTANGEQVGSLSRVVVRPETNVVTHIVVQNKSLLKREERVVPVDDIAEAVESYLILRPGAGELESLPLLEEKHFAPSEDNTNISPPTFQPMVGGIPQPTPIISSSLGDKYKTVVEQNIPSGTVAVKEGTKVLTAEGKVIGKMESLMTDGHAEHQVTHLLVSKGLITEEKKMVPIDWVSSMEEEQIYLNVDASSLQELESMSAD